MDSIRSHKLRSFLTLLGVIIGVASVIMVGAAIEGLGVYADQSTAKAFGSESFLVAQIAATGRLSRRQYFDKVKRNKPIRTDDYRFLEAVNGDSVLYSPYRNHVSDVKRENLNLRRYHHPRCGRRHGQHPRYRRGGRPLLHRARGAFPGLRRRHRRYRPHTLFPGDASPLNQIIRIEGIEFTVIGVEERLGSAFGRDQDKSLYIPITAFNRLYGPATVSRSSAAPSPRAALLWMARSMKPASALRTRSMRVPAREDNFDTLTPDAIRGFIDQLLSMVAAVVVPVTCNLTGCGWHRHHEHHAGER